MLIWVISLALELLYFRGGEDSFYTDEVLSQIVSKIKEKYPQLNSKKIVMIDDTVDILNEIMEKTDFSTAHISSFLDI